MNEIDILNNLLFKLYQTINDDKSENKNENDQTLNSDEPTNSDEKPLNCQEEPTFKPRSLLNFLKDAIPSQNGKSMISFIDPRIGIAFDESMLLINDSSIDSLRNHHIFSNLVNSIPPTSGFFTKTSTTIDQVTNIVLKQSEFANDPESQSIIGTFQTILSKMDIDKKSSDMGTFLPCYYMPGSPERIHWNQFNFNPQQDHQYDEIKNQHCSTPNSAFIPPIDNNQDYHILGNNLCQFNETKKICLYAEIARISIYRNWWEPLIFENRFWKLRDNNLIISNGENPSSGLMPLYITSIILCKNLKIKNIPPEQIENSEFISYGPFRIKSDSIILPTHRPRMSDIESSSMQILGFICEKINKSPNPDKNRKWD